MRLDLSKLKILLAVYQAAQQHSSTAQQHMEAKSFKRIIMKALTQSHAKRRYFYLIDYTAAPAHIGKNRIPGTEYALAHGSPFMAAADMAPWLSTKVLVSAWKEVSYSVSKILVLVYGTDSDFRYMEVPAEWGGKAREMTFQALHDQPLAYPRDIAHLVIGFKDCVCEDGHAGLHYAIANGHLDCLKKFPKTQINQEVLRLAATYGQLEVLEWVSTFSLCVWTPNLCSCAAWGGELATLQWLRSRNCPWDKKTINYAAIGDLRTLQWTIKANCPIEPAELCEMAARYGSVDMLEWLHDWMARQALTWPHGLYQLAAGHGQHDAFEWLRAQDLLYDPVHAMSICCRSGNLVLAKQLRHEGVPLSAAYCSTAAAYGQTRVLLWLLEQGCSCTAAAYGCAAKSGRYRMLLQWYAQEAPWAENICSIIRAKGTPRVLKWFESRA